MAIGAAIRMTIPQMPAFISAIANAPKVQLRFMRGELGRGLKRIRKNFIRSQLQGRPGIKAGPLAKGKNVFTFVGGQSLQLLGGKIGISRISAQLTVTQLQPNLSPETTYCFRGKVVDTTGNLSALYSAVVQATTTAAGSPYPNRLTRPRQPITQPRLPRVP